MLLVLLKSWGAPLGEPVADDFDFIVAHMRGADAFLSGGGSLSFWRPIPHQGYYALMGSLMLAHPWVTPLLHTLGLLGVGYLTLFALRARIGIASSSAVATFVLLSEPLRSIVAWPSHAVELSALLCLSAILWSLGTARFAWVVPFGLIGLLCKESVVLLVPFALIWPDDRWTGRFRLALGLLLALCVALWGATYLVLASQLHISPPFSITISPAEYLPTFFQRIGWATARTAAVSLGLWHLGSWKLAIAITGYALVLCFTLLRGGRSRSGAVAPLDRRLLAWSLAFAAVSILGLTVTYPLWAPYRALQPSLGLALGLVLLASIGSDRLTLVALLAAKGLTLLLAASPISTVGILPPTSANILDFERLTRLQLLCRDTREQLAIHVPDPPHFSVIAQRNFPHVATYALGGSHALQAWTGDTTLSWVGYEEMLRNPRLPVLAVVDFESNVRPSVSVIPPEAVILQIQSDSLLASGAAPEALHALDEALARLGVAPAPSFRASCQYRRAVLLARGGRFPDAMRAAELAVRGTSVGIDARFLLAVLLADQGDVLGARSQLDSILVAVPGETRATSLLERLTGSGLSR